ncbi:MAG TPA: LCP family protein [Chloroflexota bacterium]|nr:LCP family protein [Chloroflexota bacterium]
MPSSRPFPKQAAPRRGFFRRVVTVIGISAFSLIAILVAVRLFAPTWWAVPGLLLSSVSQQVPRENGATEQTGRQLTPVDTLGQGDRQGTLGGTGGQVTRHLSSAGTPNQTSGQIPAAGTLIQSESSGPPSETSGLLGSLTSGVVLPQRRFIILLLGSDNDKKFAANAVLTQSMILVSIDPATREVAMVSIPRDYWVPIPTYGYQKIDVAYEVGGIALARRTVEDLFGIHVDYYAWVGLDGLVKVIDSLGGVNVTVLHPILDETYPDDLNSADPYAFFRLYIPAGPQHLDGTTALEYVRSRHGDLQSDFGRSARQQQVLLAIKDLATDPAMISHIPDLAASLSGAVKTDLSLPQIVQLANLARGISASQIHQQVLAAPRFAELGWSADHKEQIVIPNWQAIRPEMATLLHLHPDGVSEALADQARQEKATISVLNGTGEANLANQVKDYLTWQGLSVISIGNASRFDYAHSQIIVHDESKRSTVQVLATVLNASVVDQADPMLSTDVVVIVGKDHPTLPVLVDDGVGASPTSGLSSALPSPTPIETERRSLPRPTPTETTRFSPPPTPTAVHVADNAGQVIVPNLVGMSEATAQQAITEAGLTTTYVNYQTANDVANHAYFLSIPPGAVLSQTPLPGARVPRGTKVALAVRRG